MTALKIEKVVGTPTTPKPNTLYLSSNSSDTTDLTVLCTDDAGTVIKKTVNRADLATAIGATLKKVDQVAKTADMTQSVGVDLSGALFVPPSATRTETAYLPTVGSIANIRLGSQIIVSVTRVADGTPEQYSIGLTTYSQNATANYFRSRYRGGGSAVVQGSGINVAITSTSTLVINSDTRGDMIDNVDLKIVDASTKETWSLNFIFFGNGNMNALVTKR